MGKFAISALMDIYAYLKDGEEEFREYYAEYQQKRKMLEKQYIELLGESEL